jgi:hypothetical protein
MKASRANARGAFVFVRPAWALSCGCKSRRKETILDRSEAQLREGDRLWEGSAERSRGSTNRNRVRGDAERSERAKDREAAMVKAQAT